MKTKKEYERTKERILKSKNSDIEKGNLLFGNWIDYICSSTQKSENQSLKYQSEQVRVRI